MPSRLILEPFTPLIVEDHADLLTDFLDALVAKTEKNVHHEFEDFFKKILETGGSMPCYTHPLVSEPRA